jgi:hypothetical protein
MRIYHVLLFLGFSGQGLRLSAQEPVGPSGASDTLVAGCSGGDSGGGLGLVVTGVGGILEWQKDGPGAITSEDYRLLGNDSARTAAVFAELARIRFRSIEQHTQSNMTCFLSLTGSAGPHSISWPLGEPPVQLERTRHLLEALRDPGRPLPEPVPPEGSATPREIECAKGRMASEDVAACTARFNRFYGRVVPALGAVILPIVLILLRRTAIFRLAELYPPVQPRAPRRRVFASALFVGRQFFRYSAWLTVDDSHLHVSGFGPARLWVPKLSVALSDITATPERFRWGLYVRSTIRLTLARDRSMKFLVWPDEFERLAAASGGRLRLNERQTHAEVPAERSY